MGGVEINSKHSAHAVRSATAVHRRDLACHRLWASITPPQVPEIKCGRCCGRTSSRRLDHPSPSFGHVRLQLWHRMPHVAGVHVAPRVRRAQQAGSGGTDVRHVGPHLAAKWIINRGWHGVQLRTQPMCSNFSLGSSPTLKRRTAERQSEEHG